jgi:hypothetical protein
MAEARSSLSDSFVCVNKPMAAPATERRINIYPENDSNGFNPGNTIRFVFPTENRSEYLNYMYKYLKFELHNLDGTAAIEIDLGYYARALIRALFRKISASGGAGEVCSRTSRSTTHFLRIIRHIRY